MELAVNSYKKRKSLKQVASSMAIEKLYPRNSFISEIIKVENGEKTYEKLIQEIKKKYGKV